MPYKVNFTESGNSQKTPITVSDLALNKQTSLTFPGRNYAGYAPVIAENFLHLLENFANNSAPNNPVQGQVWYDNSSGVNQLKVYNGLAWSPAGLVVKSATAPSIGTSAVGDIWIDTTNKQVNIFSGTSWILIGPQVSGGTNTGARPESLIDITDQTHNVVTFYVDDTRIAIASGEAFTPKTGITGFPVINKGLTLTTSAESKFTGTSSRAESLLINSATVSGTSFMRNDQESTTGYRIVVDSDNGVVIGASQNLTIGASGSSSFISQNINGNTLDLKVNNAGTIITPISVASTGNITVTGDVTVAGTILPGTDNIYDLGSPTQQFRHAYIANGSLYIGNIKLSNNSGKLSVKKVSDPGGENEEDDPEDSDGASDIRSTTKLTNGSHTVKLESTGTLTLDGGSWALTPNGTTLYIAYNGVNLAKLDSSGNLTVKGTVTPSGTI